MSRLGKRLSLLSQGYARLNNAEAALDVLREFWQQGGEPDDTMFEVLVNLCVRTGEFRKALQVSPHANLATADLQQQCFVTYTAIAASPPCCVAFTKCTEDSASGPVNWTSLVDIRQGWSRHTCIACDRQSAVPYSGC